MTKSWFRLPGSAVLLSSFFVDKGFNLLDKYRQSRGFFCQIPELSLQVSMDAIIAGQARPGAPRSYPRKRERGRGQDRALQNITHGASIHVPSEPDETLQGWLWSGSFTFITRTYSPNEPLLMYVSVYWCWLVRATLGMPPPHWCQVIPIMIFWCIIVPVTREPVLDIIRGGGDHNNIRTEAHTSINRQPIRE